MEETKGEIKDYILKQSWFIIIFLLFLVIAWILWKFLEIRFYEKEELRLAELEYKLEKEKIIKKELEYRKMKEHISNLDLFSDTSLTKFVNNKVSFDELGYIPEELVWVASKHVIDWKWWYIKVRKELSENLIKLSEQFYKDTGNNIVVVSWYRSYNYQKGIKDRWCPDNLCAKAWYSEHQSGLAIDIYSASSERNWVNDNNLKKYFSWFSKNAHKYWFHQSYQKWLEIDWYEVEPWHWRYLWTRLAKYLHENEITFAEFYNKKTLK